MSGTFPSSPAPSSVRLSSITPSRVSVTHSLRRIVRSSGAHRWRLEVAWPRLRRELFAPVWAFAIAQKGQVETFEFPLPANMGPRGTAGGNPVVNGAQDIGESIATINWNASETVLRAGDFLRFAGHSKLYMLRQDVTSASNGSAALPIAPALQAGVVHGEGILVAALSMRCAFVSDETPIDIGPHGPGTFSYKTTLLEVP